jgi:hypothetical protein
VRSRMEARWGRQVVCVLWSMKIENGFFGYIARSLVHAVHEHKRKLRAKCVSMTEPAKGNELTME